MGSSAFFPWFTTKAPLTYGRSNRFESSIYFFNRSNTDSDAVSLHSEVVHSVGALEAFSRSAEVLTVSRSRYAHVYRACLKTTLCSCP